MAQAPGTPPQSEAPAPPPAVAPPPPVVVAPAAAPAPAASVPASRRWIVPVIAGILVSLLVQYLTAVVGLAQTSLLVPVVLGFVAGIFVAGRLAKATTAAGWATAGILVVIGQMLLGVVILNLFLT